ncbi:MAG: undecaprenyl/decaprenyl-phosphate alpha-N-acetylglucosaminyl 1-phosphate transferase [Elusimicrobia bacterium]|nr:undecaprenyl/decaprenyl-phosphate alpha-N-acetylglucosaminyl 1-phosphate transferase [Elusimicrobiota bacterium]
MNVKTSHKIYLLLTAGVVLYLLHPKGGTWSYIIGVRWLYVFLLSFFLSIFFTIIAIYSAHKLKLLDHPDGRKVHILPTPRIGGIAIFLAFLFTLLRNLQFSRELMGLLIGGTIIFILGLLDDVYPLGAVPRIALQILASLIVIKSGVSITFIPSHWPMEKLLEAIITVLWFIGIANAVNFLDGIDGLVSSFGVMCSLLFFLIAMPTEQTFLGFLCIALAGACTGFLFFNWNPAKIFLGDSGSTFIGFVLAGIGVMGSWAENNPVVALSTPLLILGIPIFDMIYTTISRIKNGRVRNVRQWLEYVGKDHFHHRLMKMGFSIPRSVGFIVLLSLSLGLGALVIRDAGTTGSLILIVQATVFFLVVVLLMLTGRQIAD